MFVFGSIKKYHTAGYDWNKCNYLAKKSWAALRTKRSKEKCPHKYTEY